MLWPDPCLALELNQILQTAQSMNRAIFEDNGEALTIPTRAEHHLRLELKTQQLVGPGFVEETSSLRALNFFAIQKCLHRSAGLREVSLQLGQRCTRQIKSNAMGTVNLHRCASETVEAERWHN